MKIKTREELNYYVGRGNYDKRIKAFKTLYTHRRPSPWQDIHINPMSRDSFTDGKDVFIGFFDEELGRDLSEILYMLEAKIAHEAGHINFTDMEGFGGFVDSQPYYVRQMCHNIFNIVEDGRIEYLMCNSYKALKNKILFLRIVLFYDDIKQEVNENKLVRMLSNLLYYATIGVVQDDYRDNMDDDFKKLMPYIDQFVVEASNEKALEIFKEIWKIIEEAFKEEIEQAEEDAKAQEELQELLEELMSELQQKLEDENILMGSSTECMSGNDYDGDLDEENSPRISGGSQEGDAQENSKESQEKEGDNSSGSGNKEAEDAEEKDLEGAGENAEGSSETQENASEGESGKTSSETTGEGENGEDSKDSPGNDSSESGGNMKNLSNKPGEVNTGIDQKLEEIKKALEEAKKKEEASSEELKRKKAEKEFVKQQEECAKEAQKDADNIVSALNKQGDTMYPKMLSDILRNEFEENDFRKDFIAGEISPEYKEEAKKLNHELETTLANKNAPDVFFQDKGMLDQQNLYQAAVGINDSVFIRRGNNVKCDYAISILIDGSGSMEGKKIKDAIKAASIIEDALAGIDDISFRIVSYSAYNYIDHNLIRDFEDRDNKNYSEASYDKINHDILYGVGNCEYINILYESRILQKRPEAEKIMIVLSDGLPCPANGMRDAVHVTSKVVEKVKKDGIEVVPIFFTENGDFPEEMLKSYKTMYKDNLIHVASEDISKKLTKVLETIVGR